MTVICVDLSSYQKGFNFQTFKSSGGLGVILKATEGTSIKDSSYSAFRSGAIVAGLKVASYHFFHPAEPHAQAAFYLSVAKPVAGERVVCDWEISGCDPDLVVEFFKAIRQMRPDLQLTVYSGNVAKEQLGSTRNAWLAENTSLWVAQYSKPPPSWPTATWPQWSLWQYSGSGQAPGFSGQCDLNEFNGTSEQFLEWMGPAATISPPAAQLPVVTISADRPVRITLGANVTLSEGS